MIEVSRRIFLKVTAGSGLVAVALDETIAQPSADIAPEDFAPPGYALVCVEGPAGLMALTAMRDGVLHRVIARVPD